MPKSPLDENRIFALIAMASSFFVSLFQSIPHFIRTLFSKKQPSPLPPNRFLELLHFIFVTGPKKFWKEPRAINMGRSISTLLHFIFERDTHFKEEKSTLRKNNSPKAFTLIEVMISIALLAIILVFSVGALGQIGFLKTRTTDRIDLTKDLYTNIEQLVSAIKDAGGIDYEEYWNRSAVGTGTTYGSYTQITGLGNFGRDGDLATFSSYGNALYNCQSGNNSSMWTGGCLSTYNDANVDEKWSPQRYGQYALQFKDLNADKNLIVAGTADDEDLGEGPYAIATGAILPELYLIKYGNPDSRTLFRYRLEQDPEAIALGKTCPSNATNAHENGCRGMIETLKLVGRDYWKDHTTASTSNGLYDGKTDTWVCAAGFNCAGATTGSEKIATGTGSEWVAIFSDDINVESLAFDPSPRRDPSKNWKNLSINSPDMIAPSVRLSISMGFSWKKRKKMPSSNPVVTIATTINLSTK